MERYNVRIALHGASPAIYDMLGQAMSRLGGASFIEAGSGRMRRLRPGEYVFASALEGRAFLKQMETIVRGVWIDSGIRVTGVKGTCSSGAEPIPGPPTEDGQPEYATLP
jgi:hypothetical protein